LKQLKRAMSRQKKNFKFTPIEYKFSKVDATTYVYKATDDRYLALEFKVSDQNTLELRALRSGEVREEIDLLHYSLHLEKDAMSFLFRIELPELGPGIVSFSFGVNYNQHDNLEMTDQAFNYILGPGAMVGWDQQEELLIELCDQGDSYDALFAESMALWQAPLQDRLTLLARKSTGYPPFSDLNNHCIYLIDDRLVIQQQESAIPGLTTSIFNQTKNKIIDSTVFIWLAEWGKFLNNLPKEKLSQKKLLVLAHEVGHLLGLDHQFKKPSVMSYEHENLKGLTDYDRRAIRALYPLSD